MRGQPLGELRSAWSKPASFHALAKAFVELNECARENLAKIINNAAALGGDVGFLKKNLARAPEALEADLDVVADRLALRGAEVLVLQRSEEKVNGVVLLEDRGALGLGRMRGENRLDADMREGLRDLLLGEAGVLQALELLAPEAGLVEEAVLDLAQAARSGWRHFPPPC